MTTTVEAIYEHGKLVLPQPLALPEHAHVRVTIESDLPLDLEQDSPELEAELLKTANGPFTTYSADALRDACEKVIKAKRG
jgi:predicted DNA-binding antitoxin AbrB/MazE fold protein